VYIGPLVFAEIFKPKLWGGRALARVSGKRLPPGKVGETWEISDHPNGVTAVSGGPLDGKTLRYLMQKHRRSLIGESPHRRFPLIVKLVDAEHRLSLQVHPDDEQARRLKLRDSGKVEAWYVLESRSSGCLVTGLKSPGDLARLEELARSGELASRLISVHPKAGEAWLCEPGSLHALGPGLVVLEVQQNSDATLRLYDWGRRPSRGVERPLHLKESLVVLRGGMSKVRRGRPARLRGFPVPAERLIAADRFVMDKWHVAKPLHRSKPGRFEILHVLSGAGSLCDGRWPEIALKRGRTVLAPADVSEYDIVPSRRLEIIRAAEPEGGDGA
jgi:mannose-6-phosphate isomerase